LETLGYQRLSSTEARSINAHRPQFSFFRYGLDVLQRVIIKLQEFGAQFLRLLGFLLDGKPLNLHESIPCDMPGLSGIQ
jgi:hypothetical protein